MTAVLRTGSRSIARPAGALALLALAIAALLSVGVRPAAAVEPTNLRDQLTDGANVLSAAEEAEVRGALTKLQDATDVQLWVWYTTTTNGQDIVDFAAQTAQMSSLGGTDLLLVIALDDRAYGFSSPEGFPLSDPEIEQLLSRELEPGLRTEDYAGAIVSVATALEAELNATPAPVVTEKPTAVPSGGGSTDGQNGGGGGLGTLLMVVIIVALVAGIGWFFFVRRRFGAAVGVPGGGPGGAAAPGTPADPLAGMSDKDLNAEANRLLLATDDAVRDSEQELGFAQAQFGEAAAAPFATAINAAKEDLRTAFHVRQQLDDATPEDKPTRRRMLTDLIGRCRAAQDRLDKEAGRFEELRAFEKEAPTVLAGLPATAAAVEARLPAVETTMAHLTDYADTAWEAVAPNLDEARGRIAAARAAVTEGEAATAAGDGPKVAAAARVGQEALAQAGAFLDAIERLSAELDQARDKVTAEITDAEADLARARTAAASATAGGDPGLPARLAEADTLLADARREIGVPKPDVAAAYAKARRANEIADEALAGIRTAAEQQAALAARLDTSIRGAQATLTRASDYVATHRGGVGGEARTRLAEAKRHLDQAVAAGAADPAAGIREAEQASRMANEALSLAQRDYGGWDDPWRGGGGGRGGPSGGGGGGGDVAAAIIGGIIGGMLSGGGRGGGGFGGFPGGGGGWGGGGGSIGVVVVVADAVEVAAAGEHGSTMIGGGVALPADRRDGSRTGCGADVRRRNDTEGTLHGTDLDPRPHGPAGASQHQRDPRLRRGPREDAEPDGRRLHQQHPRGRGGGRPDDRQPAAPGG